jgi:hypothetical protein
VSRKSWSGTVQVAALALASHKALLPYLRDEQEVLKVGRRHTAASKPWQTSAVLLICCRPSLQRGV